jgi:hypothetical protein
VVSVCAHTKCQERNIEQNASVAALTFGGRCMCPYKVSGARSCDFVKVDGNTLPDVPLGVPCGFFLGVPSAALVPAATWQ